MDNKNKKKCISLTLLLTLLFIMAGIYFFVQKKIITIGNVDNVPALGINQSIPSDQGVQNSSSNQNITSVNGFQSPLDRAAERVTKKPFGIYITPKNSPVQPEKFQGYHTGTDFEIFPEELNADVFVSAVCQGKLLMKKYASGYGGVAVQACEFDGQPSTVVYGHLKLASISTKVGDDLNVGDKLGILGAAYSSETNGERKHLHLGFHKGSIINILGYVAAKNLLPDWLDPCQYVCLK